jgi:hypothetical protein
MHELVVENTKVLLDGEVMAVSIGIDEGRISRI